MSCREVTASLQATAGNSDLEISVTLYGRAWPGLVPQCQTVTESPYSHVNFRFSRPGFLGGAISYQNLPC